MSKPMVCGNMLRNRPMSCLDEGGGEGDDCIIL